MQEAAFSDLIVPAHSVSDINTTKCIGYLFAQTAERDPIICTEYIPIQGDIAYLFIKIDIYKRNVAYIKR